MRITGYCTSCHRVRTVTVSGNNLALAMARKGVVQGVCSSCEEAEDARRRERRGR